MDFLNLKKVHLVMDRGFYSKDNINELYKGHHKFLIGAKLSLRLVKEQRGKWAFYGMLYYARKPSSKANARDRTRTGTG